MKDHLLLGVSHHVVPIPRFIWQRELHNPPQAIYVTRITQSALFALPRTSV